MRAASGALRGAGARPESSSKLLDIQERLRQCLAVNLQSYIQGLDVENNERFSFRRILSDDEEHIFYFALNQNFRRQQIQEGLSVYDLGEISARDQWMAYSDRDKLAIAREYLKISKFLPNAMEPGCAYLVRPVFAFVTFIFSLILISAARAQSHPDVVGTPREVGMTLFIAAMIAFLNDLFLKFLSRKCSTLGRLKFKFNRLINEMASEISAMENLQSPLPQTTTVVHSPELRQRHRPMPEGSPRLREPLLPRGERDVEMGLPLSP